MKKIKNKKTMGKIKGGKAIDQRHNVNYKKND